MVVMCASQSAVGVTTFPQVTNELGDAVCVQVIKSGGITGVLNLGGATVNAEPSIDSNALKDSLDCLAGSAASSQEGAQICLESGALPAACSALQVPF